MNSADIIKSVLKSSVGPKMAENTLQRHEIDNQNSARNKVQYQNLSISVIASTVMANVFTNTTPKAEKRNRSKKYLSTFNLWSLSVSYTHLTLPTKA